jgi:hypothetical protein
MFWSPHFKLLTNVFQHIATPHFFRVNQSCFPVYTIFMCSPQKSETGVLLNKLGLSY